MKLRNIIITAVVSLTLTANAFAGATLGPRGKVTTILRSVGQNSYALAVGIDDNDDGTADRMYYGGGTWCEGVNALSDSQIETLERAALQGLTVMPASQIAPSGARCLTQFTVYY